MDYLTEEEQVERIRKFWKEYGFAIVAGIIIAIVVVLGWRYYKGYEAKQSQSASLVYTTMMNSTLANQPKSAVAAANSLKKDYPHSPYASMAALWLAKQSVEQKQYTNTATELNWVLDHARMKSLKQTARIRLAQLNLQQGKPQQALALLNKVDDSAYVGLIDEVRGDAYLMQKQTAKANAAYQKALKELPQPDRTRPILAMKIASLPVQAAQSNSAK